MKSAQALHLARIMGWRWLAFRVGYAAKIHSGHLRRMLPVTDWSSQPLGSFLKDTTLATPQRYFEYRKKESPPFFFNPSQRNVYRDYLARWDAHSLSRVAPVQRADDVKDGILRYFEHTAAKTGCPPDWHANPFTGQEATSDRHWSRIGDFEHGDIKVIWEANRFGFVYTLVRAYWRTGDERYAECFWQWVADWKEKNLPQAGVNWKCGQEISIRLMAWLFGLYGFLSSGSTTPERMANLAQMIAVSAERIEKNIAYALSQQNNHGISEALGLWTVGLLFPEFQATHYLLTGTRCYPDGAWDEALLWLFGPSAVGASAVQIERTDLRADENSPRGWCSHYYYDKEPALSVAAEIHDRCGFFFTIFGPDGFTCHYENEVLDIGAAKWRCTVNFKMDRSDNKKPNISYAHVTGELNERFEIN
ncbi:MAG: heparinase II/III family protein [Pseudomonadota bacterium]